MRIPFAGGRNLRDMFTFCESPTPAKTKKFSRIIAVRTIIMIEIRHQHIHAIYSDRTNAASISNAVIEAKTGTGKAYLQ